MTHSNNWLVTFRLKTYTLSKMIMLILIIIITIYTDSTWIIRRMYWTNNSMYLITTMIIKALKALTPSLITLDSKKNQTNVNIYSLSFFRSQYLKPICFWFLINYNCIYFYLFIFIYLLYVCLFIYVYIFYMYHVYLFIYISCLFIYI